MTSLSIIGVGAFGTLAHAHLKGHFDIILHDPNNGYDTPIETAAKCDIVLLCTPVCTLKDTLQTIASHLRTGQLIMDVCSVKIKPVAWMKDILPDDIDIVATHPIFGPQSGKDGIKGLSISLVSVRGDRLAGVEKFCVDILNLKTIITSAEKHDAEMAYVQGLTHLIAKILKRMDVPELNQTTQTYNHLLSMVDMIKNDSPELFHAIQTDNPYVHDVAQDFFAKAQDLEKSLLEAKDA